MKALFEIIRVDRFAKAGRSDLIAALLLQISPLFILCHIVGFRMTLWWMDFLFGVVDPDVSLGLQVVYWVFSVFTTVQALKELKELQILRSGLWLKTILS